MGTRNRLKQALVGIFAMVACASVANADSKTDPTIKAQLTEFFDRAAKVMNDTASAQALADMFYAKDLTVIGNDEKHLVPDLQSFMAPLQSYLGNRACRLTLIGEPRHSGDMAAAWVQEHCDQYQEHPVENYRVLYVLKKGPEGWRVVMEMYGTGVF